MTPDPVVGRIRALTSSLESLASAGIRVGARGIAASDERSLHDAERESIGSARDVRRREFATGRALLRDLIGMDVAIPVGSDRRPVLPAGVRASLAHDGDIAVAAVTHHPGISALGIDIERRGELEPDAVREILRPDDIVGDPVLAFVLKEAAYKAWSNLGGRMLEHQEMRVTVRDQSFTAVVEPTGDGFNGRFALAGDTWLALVVVPTTA